MTLSAVETLCRSPWSRKEAAGGVKNAAFDVTGSRAPQERCRPLQYILQSFFINLLL